MVKNSLKADEKLGFLETLSDNNMEVINLGFPEMDGSDHDNCEDDDSGLYSLQRAIDENIINSNHHYSIVKNH
ncbi:unnamed protein product [Lepeophtheirus salmonis]|uniref:(salmon louse) hypothetical protein n=1 Tax=Lepeophtheirus salmonis TaxID=72036 RepID=A0A7R8CEP7_LEPSM|nr:unnamed protein product [Lepeophtheirus salmonis]CAF2754469.1 unnamed protein product [Lepeophtheirus salmonis]